MRFAKLISLSSPKQRCQGCFHFKNDPKLIEEAYKGLTSMSSGFASVRDMDGICGLHQLYLSAHDHCTSFQSFVPSLREETAFTGE